MSHLHVSHFRGQAEAPRIVPFFPGRLAPAVGGTIAPGIHALDGLDPAVQKDLVHHAVTPPRLRRVRVPDFPLSGPVLGPLRKYGVSFGRGNRIEVMAERG